MPHLHSILTNPLFEIGPNARLFQPIREQAGRDDNIPIGQHKEFVNNPIEGFKVLVSAGMADIMTATLCLSLQYKLCCDSPNIGLSDAMRSSKAGSTVLDWLRSSGIEESGGFLINGDFIKVVIPFLVAEERHGRILHWLQKCYQMLSEVSTQAQFLQVGRRIRHIFHYLIKAELEIGKGLESATLLFTQTVPSIEAGVGKRRLLWVIAPAAWVLIDKTIYCRSALVKLEDSTIEAFGLIVKASDGVSLLEAFRCIYFSRTSDPRAALQFFEKASTKMLVISSPVRRYRLVFLGMKAAELFFQDDRPVAATWMMEFLQTNFEQELGSPGLSPYEELQKAREEKSLDLLDILAAVH